MARFKQGMGRTRLSSEMAAKRNSTLLAAPAATRISAGNGFGSETTCKPRRPWRTSSKTKAIGARPLLLQPPGHHLDRHADLDLVRIHVRELRRDADSLLQLHQRDDVGSGKALGSLRHLGEGVHGAAAREAIGLECLAPAFAARAARRELHGAAFLAALALQPV